MKTLPLARSALLIGLFLPVGASPLLAQRTPPAPPESPRPAAAPRPRPQIYMNGMTTQSGGLLGITLRSSTGAADTLGVLVESVQEGLPADKAGISEGARIVSIDGIDLRLEPRDIGDSAAERLPESRLRRAISGKAAGQSVTLEVRQGSRTETKPVTLAEAPGARVFSAAGMSSRRVLGVGFAQRGTMRDTAGLLITSLTDGGAAEKAGLMEGDRVVSVDGVDLRVPSADAGSPDGVTARISRLRRALDAASDSQPVRLEVVSEGRRRTVSVIPTRDTGWGNWSFSPGQMEGMAADIRASVNRSMALSDDDRREIERTRSEAVREGQRARQEGMRIRERAMRDGQRDREEGMREAQREMIEGQREMARARVEIERATRDGVRMRIEDDDDNDDNDAEARGARRGDRRSGGMLRGRTDGATLALDGLSLASVDRDFGQQLGKGAERGALVVRTRDTWEPLRAGDVILSIEGRSVRDGNALDVTIDRSRDQRLEILRNGRQQTITLRPSR